MHLLAPAESDRLNLSEEAAVELVNGIGPERLQCLLHLIDILAEATDVHLATNGRKWREPLLNAQEHLERSTIVATLYLVIGNAYLKDASIEIAPGRLVGHPGFFKVVVALVIVACVEHLDAFGCEVRERLVAGPADVLSFGTARIAFNQLG